MLIISQHFFIGIYEATLFAYVIDDSYSTLLIFYKYHFKIESLVDSIALWRM